MDKLCHDTQLVNCSSLS